MPDITSASLMSGEDGQALTKHPDAVLNSGELWTCSCGTTSIALTTLTCNLCGVESEQPSYAWCPTCNDLACWEPAHTAHRGPEA